MKKNMSKIDSGVRFLIAAIILTLFLTGVISGTLAYVLIAVSAIFVITGLVNFCPIYSVFKISSRK